MPLKRAVMPMLAEVDDWAAAVGAANTVLFGDRSGDWHGANTDVPGMVAVLRAAGVDVDRRHGSHAVGARRRRHRRLRARRTRRARVSVRRSSSPVGRRRPATCGPSPSRVGIDLDVRPWAEIAGRWPAPLVIATTPAGATDELARPV